MVSNAVSLARVNWWGSRVRVWRGSLPSTLCPSGPERVTDNTPKQKKAAQPRLPARAVPGLSEFPDSACAWLILLYVNSLDSEDEGDLAEERGHETASQGRRPSKGP